MAPVTPLSSAGGSCRQRRHGRKGEQVDRGTRHVEPSGRNPLCPLPVGCRRNPLFLVAAVIRICATRPRPSEWVWTRFRPQTGWWRRGTAHHRPPSSGGAVRAAEPGLSLVGRACPDDDPPISTGKAYGTSLAERPANRGDNFLARVACRWGDRRGRAREAASAPRSPAGRSTSAGVTAGQRVRPGTIAADRKGLVAT